MKLTQKHISVLLFVLLVAQFIYFSVQVSLIKDVVTKNADGANKREQAQNYVLLKVLDIANTLKGGAK